MAFETTHPVARCASAKDERKDQTGFDRKTKKFKPLRPNVWDVLRFQALICFIKILKG
jgi:hypothetical protein